MLSACFCFQFIESEFWNAFVDIILVDTDTAQNPPVQGSFLNLLPTQIEVSESPEASPHRMKPPPYPHRAQRR